MMLLETPLKVPYFEKYCPINKKEPAEGLSLDSFSNSDKLKSYDFEPTVSDNENTDGEVSSSAMQTKEAEKERKGNLDWCLCRKCKAMSTNTESLCSH